MKHRITILFLIALAFCISSFAQNQKEKMTREEKNEKNQARLDRINTRNDIAVFRKQMLGLKEYANEKKKLASAQKAAKMPVKLSAVVDSDAVENASESKTLIGYIKQDAGDNSINLYEITYDRQEKKIISVKRTPEAAEADKEAAEEKEDKPEKAEKPEKAAPKKTVAKKAVPKKNKDEDEDDDTDDEKPSKNKDKDDE